MSPIWKTVRVAVRDVVPVVVAARAAGLPSAFGRSSAVEPARREAVLGTADLERHLQTVVGRRIAIRIERREAGPRIGRGWRGCRHRAWSRRDRAHSRRPASCTCRSPSRASTGAVFGAPSSQFSSHLSATAHGFMHSTALPVSTCAVAVARTSWLVMPMIWAKNVGSALERAGAAVDVRTNAGVGQTRRARRARNELHVGRRNNRRRGAQDLVRDPGGGRRRLGPRDVVRIVERERQRARERGGIGGVLRLAPAHPEARRSRSRAR